MGAMSRRHSLIALFLAFVAGLITLAAAQPMGGLADALSAKLPMPDVIRWDPVRQVWIDMKTRGVITVTSNSVTNPAPGTTVAAAPTYTQQGETRPQRWSDKSFFPLVIPDAEWFKTCGKIQDDPLTHIASKCDVFKDVVNCQQLAQMGYLPSGVQSFVPGGNLNGGFQVPNGCSSGNLGVEYDGIKMVFNSPQIPILAVIAKDLPLSRVYYFGSGVTQGRLMNIIMLKAEFCYAPPNISPLYVSKTATYSTGMQPGTAAWSFFKTVALAPPFSNNVAAMFKGDSADATWTLNVQKTGTDTVYQGAVNGQITITNPQNAPVTVYNINDYVQGGPQSTVSCGSPVPFQIQPCSSTVCNYVGYWPTAPTPGSYTNLADVQYSVGSTSIMGNQVGTSIFQVTPLSAAVGMINTAAGAIPAGQAVVQDGMAPQAYGFSGTSQQSYTSQLTCPDTAILTNQAVLTASTGQQITQTATVQKLCYELAVRVAQTSAPYVGRWEWTVSKIASVQNVTLKPAETAWDRYVKQQLDLAQAAGQDTASAMNMITGGQNFTALTADAMPGSTNEEVTYTVTFTRNAPQALAGNTPAFQSMGEVYITNSSPLNAQLKEVQVSMTNPFGGLPYTTMASCPMLTVAAGQTLTCRYIATPSFNPVGASVSASAIYLNNRNGVPTGATTAFTSASIMVGAAAAAGEGAASGRKLQAATSGGGDNRANNTLANVISNLLKPPSSTTTTSLTINNLPPIPIPNLPEFPNISGIISSVGGNSSRSSNGSSSGFNLSKFMSDVAKNLAEDSKKDRDSEDEQIDVTITPKGSSSEEEADAPADVPATTPAPAPATTVAAAAAAGNPSAPPQMPLAPVVAAAPAAADLKGLQQECVDVSDVFVMGDDYVTGMLVAGTFPSGKICSTTTFTYTVRYGPFKDCFTKEATNKASWVAADTQQAGNASSTINLSVVGCGAAVAAKAKSYAVWAKKSYSWAVQKKSSTGTLTVGPDQIAKATYTIDYTRTEILVNPKLSTTLQFDNLAGTSAVTLSSFSYTVTSLCDGQQRQKTGTFKCAATTIPAGGAPLTCQVQTDLPCVGPGVIVAQALAKDKTVTSVPFNFPAPKSIDTLAESECAIVVDEFSQGNGLVSGNLTSGVRPYGKLCGSKQFVYTVSFGPFNTCGKQKATNVASLTTGAPTTSARADATLNIDVSGCEVYTPISDTEPVVTEADGAEVTANASANMRLGAPSKSSKPQQQQPKPSGSKTSLATGKGVGPTNCVSSVSFWKGCMSSGNLAGRCAVVLKLPTGPHTAFFPAPQSRVVRTYKAVMGKGTSSGVKSTDQWFKAAQAVAATQLNELAGVTLPADVRNALSLAGAAVGVSTTVPPVLATELQGVSNAVALLEKFSTGQAGVKQC